MKYKRIIITHPGGPEVLQVVEGDVPEPQADMVRIKVSTAGVAFADVALRRGTYPKQSSGPVTPGYDIVGVVDKPGADISGFTVGQRVAALTGMGGYTEYICLPVTELAPVPDELDPAEAVSLVLNYVTAYQLLHRVAKVKPGARILIHGAAGGVGTALLQLGKLANLEMYGTASSSKQKLVSELGGTSIDYQQEDFVERIQNLTGDGVDAVFDAVGGENLERSYRTLRAGGRLVGYGMRASLKDGKHNPQIGAESAAIRSRLQNLQDGRTVTSYFIGSLKASHPHWFREALTTLFKLLAPKKIAPVIAKRLPLEEAAQANELLEKSQVMGKIVLYTSG